MVELDVRDLPEQKAKEQLASWIRQFRKAAREQCGLSKTALSRKVFATERLWAYWEKGQYAPNGLSLLCMQQKAREWGLIEK